MGLGEADPGAAFGDGLKSRSLKSQQSGAMLSSPILQGSNMARPRKPTLELAAQVNVVGVKGHPSFYLHIGRGTKGAGSRVRLPADRRP
jgi:hypothetical protein